MVVVVVVLALTLVEGSVSLNASSSSSSPKQNAFSIADIGRFTTALPCPRLFPNPCPCTIPRGTPSPCPRSEDEVLVLSPPFDFVGPTVSIEDRACETASEPSCLDDVDKEGAEGTPSTAL